MPNPEIDPFDAAYDEFVAGAEAETDESPTDEVDNDEAVEVEDTEDVETPADEADEETDEVVDEDDEDEEQPADDATVIDVPEDAVLRLEDGSEIAVKDSALRQADYTKKTQAVAARERELDDRENEITQAHEQLVTYIEERQSDPAGWVTEIISGSQEPTVALARAMRDLAASGRLESRFVEAFGLEQGEVADLAKQGDGDDRVSKLEKQLQEREDREAAEREHQSRVAAFQQQYQNVTSQLQFESPETEREFRVELLEYAKGNGLTNLEVAFKAWAHDNSDRLPASRDAAPKRKPDPAVQQKKRAARAVSPKSAAAPGGKPKATKALTSEEAALQVVEEFASRS